MKKKNKQNGDNCMFADGEECTNWERIIAAGDGKIDFICPCKYFKKLEE